jgi:hypothetical protein
MNDDGPNYEKDNHGEITVFYHSRKKFYGKDIYWYEFSTSNDDIDHLIPQGFINVPMTVLYEFGGTHKEALNELTKAGFTSIMEGQEI